MRINARGELLVGDAALNGGSSEVSASACLAMTCTACEPWERTLSWRAKMAGCVEGREATRSAAEVAIQSVVFMQGRRSRRGETRRICRSSFVCRRDRAEQSCDRVRRTAQRPPSTRRRRRGGHQGSVGEVGSSLIAPSQSAGQQKSAISRIKLPDRISSALHLVRNRLDKISRFQFSDRRP